jgi:hypothetical protein
MLSSSAPPVLLSTLETAMAYSAGYYPWTGCNRDGTQSPNPCVNVIPWDTVSSGTPTKGVHVTTDPGAAKNGAGTGSCGASQAIFCACSITRK